MTQNEHAIGQGLILQVCAGSVSVLRHVEISVEVESKTWSRVRESRRVGWGAGEVRVVQSQEGKGLNKLLSDLCGEK